ncbi:DUF6353 family protein [Fibrobacter sp.]|uniref:DUF6353 family protein n=1 Tax=Fibrobacter sp. TaxID=35828 RepID=UPI00388FFBB9
MGNSAMSGVVKSIQTTLTKHGPKILTGVGIVGMVGTTVMAVKATPKALQLIEERKKKEKCEKLHPIEVVKTTWKCYIPAAITGVTSTACLIKANSIHTRRNAALATAYNLTKTTLAEYKDKVVETIGEKKEQVIREEIAKDRMEQHPVNECEVVHTDDGKTLCYDMSFGRYFYSDIDRIKRAFTNINRVIVTSNYVSLNEFYAELGLPPVEMGDELGWNLDSGEIKEELSTTLASNGQPCLAFRYSVQPKDKYDSWL